jgi:ubiquinone/menaquinone biosynthesis C-methylase UbiE
MSTTGRMPSPEIIFDTLFAYQKSAALKAAIDLNLFTAIDEGAHTAPAIASRISVSERGARILCDYLTVNRLLAKTDDGYQLVAEASAFLSKRSPAYLGSIANFLLRPELKNNFENLIEAVRRGGVGPNDTDIVSNENPVWVEFARSMMPMMIPAAQAIAEQFTAVEPIKVLDIAAGHGAFGIALARRNPNAEIVAVDWKAVLGLAEAHAKDAGVLDRYRTIAGDAFNVEYGSGYDIVLVTNFLHHFDAATNTSMLKKVYAALKPGGRVAVLEFVPNPDRVSPPMPAAFSLTMLAETAGGDAFTFAELREQLENVGFRDVEAHGLPTPQTLLIARK